MPYLSQPPPDRGYGERVFGEGVPRAVGTEKLALSFKTAGRFLARFFGKR